MHADNTAFDAMLAARDAAYWAGSAAAAAWVIGLGGLAINCVGLLFIRGQLKANREALSATKDSADAAARSTDIALAGMRPWIKVDPAPNEPNGGERAVISLHGGDRIARLRIVFRNVGETPALGCWLGAEFLRPGGDVAEAFRRLQANVGRKTIFPGQELIERIEVFVGDREGIFGSRRVLVVANYRISGATHWVHSPLVVTVLEGGPTELVGFEPLVFPGEQHWEVLTYTGEQPIDPV